MPKKTLKKLYLSKDKKPEKYELFVVYSQTSEGGDYSPGQEDDAQFKDREDTYLSTSFKYITRTRPVNLRFPGDYKTIEVDRKTYDLEKAFISVIFYTSGDTFSTTHGYFEVLGAAASREQAHQILQDSEKRDYKPWDGFFNRLDGKDVFKLDIED